MSGGKFSYKFSNLCGTVYRAGNLLFTPDGNSLLSPVGNRVSVFDLVNSTSHTLPFENRKNIHRIALSPNGLLLISVDIDGHALLVNYPRQVVLSHFNFKAKVEAIKFSPDGRYVAVNHEAKLQIWRTPTTDKEFAPFVLHRTYTGHQETITSLDWSEDSQYVLTGSRDHSMRIFSSNAIEEYIPFTLTGHRDFIISCYWAKGSKTIYSVSRDGACFEWKWMGPKKRDEDGNVIEPDEDEEEESLVGLAMYEGRWKLARKNIFKQGSAKVVSATFHREGHLLVAGFSNGLFALYDMPDFNCVHSLSISQKKITAVSVNSTGEWLAFGSAKLGQLLVWEWQSETYVLKQQGHFYDMNCLAYSPDGQLIATGGDDGKVKIWNTTTGFCFVTFSEHTATVTGICFSPHGNAVITSSLDGTVRAFDLVRYRNFRVLTADRPTQFSSVSVDPSGEIVCASALDTFEMYHRYSSKLLDTLAGHSAPVSAVAFSPSSAHLASASWDKTVRVWEMYSAQSRPEVLEHSSDVLAVVWRPDGRELCSSSLDGDLTFWDPIDGNVLRSIEGRADVGAGRRIDDPRTSKNSTWGKCFASVCYSADGRCVLAGGNSKFVCIYAIEHKILLRKFTLSQNRSLDGILDFLNSRNMTEAGALELIDDDDDDDEADLANALPGVNKDSLKKRPAIRTKHVQFAPSGRSWAAATTEGLLIYSLDESIVFDPFQLDIDITPQSIRATVANAEFLKALIMSLRLNEYEITSEVFESIPHTDIQLIVGELPLPYLQKFLGFFAKHMDTSQQLEFHLLWVLHLFSRHGRHLKQNAGTFMSIFRSVQKYLLQQYEDLSKLCDSNRYTLEYLSILADRTQALSATPTVPVTMEIQNPFSGDSEEGADEDELMEEPAEPQPPKSKTKTKAKGKGKRKHTAEL